MRAVPQQGMLHVFTQWLRTACRHNSSCSLLNVLTAQMQKQSASWHSLLLLLCAVSCNAWLVGALAEALHCARPQKNCKCEVSAGGRYDGLLKAVWPKAAAPMSAVGVSIAADGLVARVAAARSSTKDSLPASSQVRTDEANLLCTMCLTLF